VIVERAAAVRTASELLATELVRDLAVPVGALSPGLRQEVVGRA
jgi:hypothetical protein